MALFALLAAFAVSGQTKEYDFSGFQTSDSNMKWLAMKNVGARKAKFSDTKIVFSLDRIFQLSVIDKKDLPNGGKVYRCRDERKKEVTITLIGNDRMFLYSGTDRYQVAFSHPIVASAQQSYAESD
jgi:hypothetical protein